MHTPDDSTPLEDTVAALQELVAEGKARAWGHSNFSAAQIAEADRIARALGGALPASAQNHWSLLFRQVEADVVPAAEEHGVGVLPYFPLANGLLTGKVTRTGGVPEGARLTAERYATWVTDANLDRVEALSAWAMDHDRTLLEVAIGWLAGQAAVGSVIAGATKPEQVRANAAAVVRPLSAAELADIAALVPR
jgi:aryl-alcohol dehydrogenase-like predicted oxidoreductase